MSSVSSTSSNSYYYALQKKMFEKLDSDENANLSEKEFLAGKPKDIKKEQAAAIYDALDTNSSGSVTMDEFAAGAQSAAGAGLMSQLSSSALDVLVQLSQQGGMMAHGGGGAQDSPSDMAYDALDTNKDGVVSEDEFLAAHPEQQVSDDGARKLLASLDTDKNGEPGTDQFAGLLNSALPPRLMTSPLGGLTGDANAAYSLFDALDAEADDVTTSGA